MKPNMIRKINKKEDQEKKNNERENRPNQMKEILKKI